MAAAGGGGGGAAGRAYSFKVVLLGEGCVGKTSLVLRYCENKFNDKHITTLQVRTPESGERGRRLGPHLPATRRLGRPGRPLGLGRRTSACHLRPPWPLGFRLADVHGGSGRAAWRRKARLVGGVGEEGP
jgi:hypothetical protein